jgi:hypothetical protein
MPKHTISCRALGAFMLCLLLFPAYARASSLTVSGYLNDPANSALLASDGYLDLKAPRFADDSEIARNVAVYLLTVTTGGAFSFDSFGYAAFGAEPYFSLFSGNGLDAAFLTSNGIEDPINIDFSFSRALAPGDYLLAIGVWVNMSFAENNPDGTPAIGDGFTALGDPSRLGNTYYELGLFSVNGEARAVPKGDLRNEPPLQTVPEPSTCLMLASGLVGVARIVRRRTSIAPMLLPSSLVGGSRFVVPGSAIAQAVRASAVKNVDDMGRSACS